MNQEDRDRIFDKITLLLEEKFEKSVGTKNDFILGRIPLKGGNVEVLFSPIKVHNMQHMIHFDLLFKTYHILTYNIIKTGYAKEKKFTIEDKIRTIEKVIANSDKILVLIRAYFKAASMINNLFHYGNLAVWAQITKTRIELSFGYSERNVYMNAKYVKSNEKIRIGMNNKSFDFGYDDILNDSYIAQIENYLALQELNKIFVSSSNGPILNLTFSNADLSSDIFFSTDSGTASKDIK